MWVKKNNAMNQQHQIIGLKTEKLWWNDGKLSRNKAHTHKFTRSLTRSQSNIRTHIGTHTHTHHVKMYCKYKIWSWRRLTISMCIAYWCVLGVVWNYFPFIFFRFILLLFATSYIDFFPSQQNIYFGFYGLFYFLIFLGQMKKGKILCVYLYKRRALLVLFFPVCARVCLCVSDILNLMALFFASECGQIFFVFCFFSFEKALWS